MERLAALKTQIPLGILTWLAFLIYQLPIETSSLTYVELLILIAPLVLIPILLKVGNASKKLRQWVLFCNIPFAIAFFLPNGWLATICCLPWLGFTLKLVLEEMQKWLIQSDKKMSHHAHFAAALYLPVAAVWALSDRLGMPLWVFDETIILLTVVHFHYAGFILPKITAFALEKMNSRLADLIGLNVILGIPLVAIAITTTAYDLPKVIEVACVTLMVMGGMGSGIMHIILGMKSKNTFAKLAWVLGGLALLGGMILALLYGWRFYFPISFLTIPWMYAVHGTLNAIGFALPCVVGWYFQSTNSSLKFKHKSRT